MKTIKLTAAALTAILLASGVSAATLSFAGTGQQQTNLAGHDTVVGLNGQTIDYISGNLKTSANGLSVTGPARVTFTYLGYEAGNQNSSFGFGSDGNFLFENATANAGDSYTYTQASGGLINFSFHTAIPTSTIHNHDGADPATSQYAIGYYKLSDTSWYALFDDIANDDRDFDDLVLRIDVAPVPIPAAGFLLLGGLGIMGAVARRRKAA